MSDASKRASGQTNGLVLNASISYNFFPMCSGTKPGHQVGGSATERASSSSSSSPRGPTGSSYAPNVAPPARSRPSSPRNYEASPIRTSLLSEQNQQMMKASQVFYDVDNEEKHKFEGKKSVLILEEPSVLV